MGPKAGGDLLAVAELDDDALERLVVTNVAVRMQDADAPRDRFLALELVGEHAERALLAGQRMAHDVALEKQLARGVRVLWRSLLGLSRGGEGKNRQGNSRTG